MQTTKRLYHECHGWLLGYICVSQMSCKCRSHLGSFGVSGSLALQPMYSLSGGQKSRVAFAKVTYSKPHILLLDEPSNHLDLDAVRALIQVPTFVFDVPWTRSAIFCDSLE